MAKHWETVVVSSDHHVPFINQALHKNFIKLLTDIQPDRFILLGDFLDLYSLGSYHAKSLYYLRDITLQDEYDTGNIVLDDYDSVLKRTCKKTYLYGNHEDRYWRWIKSGDNAKLGDIPLSPADGLALNKRKYDVLDDWKNDYMDIGEFRLIHGDSVAINATNTMITKAMRSLVFGHVHRPQYFTRGQYTSIALGCMCDIDSSGMTYMHRHQRDAWRNGFLILNANTQTGEVIPQQIHASKEGHFYYGDKRY